MFGDRVDVGQAREVGGHAAANEGDHRAVGGLRLPDALARGHVVGLGVVVGPDRGGEQHDTQTLRAQLVPDIEPVVAQRVGRDAVGQHPADDLAASAQAHAVVLERHVGTPGGSEATLVPLAFSALRVVPSGDVRRLGFGQIGPGEDLVAVRQGVVVHPRGLDDGGEVGHADEPVQFGRCPATGFEQTLGCRRSRSTGRELAYDALGPALGQFGFQPG